MIEGSPILTTVTPTWGRQDRLKVWVQIMAGSTTPDVTHLVYFVGEDPPEWWSAMAPRNMQAIRIDKPERFSIGHVHNMGIETAQTEWVMKLDADALPSSRYFKELIPLLKKASEREWFNGGMFYLSKNYSEALFQGTPFLGLALYQMIMLNRKIYSASSYLLPAASNFICRRRDYLHLGGCDSRFDGYGWEDYQQIFSLEWYWRRSHPLPGHVDFDNVTTRCRDEISRRKARELFERNPLLCLIHLWHPESKDTGYRTPHGMAANRRVLLERILEASSSKTDNAPQ